MAPGRPPARPPALTLVAVAHGAEVHVVLVVGEEEQAEPGVEGVDGHDEEDADDVALLVGAAVAAQVHVDLGTEGPCQWGPGCHAAPPTPLRPPGGAPPRGHPALPLASSATTLLSPEPQPPPLHDGTLNFQCEAAVSVRTRGAEVCGVQAVVPRPAAQTQRHDTTPKQDRPSQSQGQARASRGDKPLGPSSTARSVWCEET